MKNFTTIFITIVFLLGCSNKSVEDLAPNVLDDNSVQLFSLFDHSASNGKIGFSFTSIYDELSPETQAAITHFSVFRNDIEVAPLPLTATRASASGQSGVTVCLSIAFGSAEGPSRRSSPFCRQIP